MKHDSTKKLAATAAARIEAAAAISDHETRRDRLAMAHAAATDAVIEAAGCAAVAVDRREMAVDVRRVVLVALEAMSRSESTAVRRCVQAAGGAHEVNDSVMRLLALLDDAGADRTLPTPMPVPTLATDAPCAMDGLDYPDGLPPALDDRDYPDGGAS